MIFADYAPVIPSARAVVHDRVHHPIKECVPFLREGRLGGARRRVELDSEERIALSERSRIRRHFVDSRAGSTIEIE